MTMTDEIRFTSGHRMVANCGILGIDADFGITEGYDAAIDWKFRIAEGELTTADLIEAADQMIARWHSFKEKLADPAFVSAPDERFL